MRAQHYLLSIHDPLGKRLCTLFDSDVNQYGSAYGIRISKEISGWKEMEFSINRFDTSGEENFRYDFAYNENLVYVYEDGVLDIYIIKTPDRLHDKSQLHITCKCNHISEQLKTRNLFKEFDDENGIGTCQDLATKALQGSGWSLGTCDTFYEADGTTEKVRTYKCSSKTGAYNMISGICKLFNARPVFHGDNNTVDIVSNESTNGFTEIMFGNNMDKITRTPKSDNLVTRLYVEGEYGDFGYVGIDDVNDGLNFILNFDYFKETGLFTETHQEAVDTYLEDYKDVSQSIRTKANERLQVESTLSGLIGITGYVLYFIVNGQVVSGTRIAGGGISKDDEALNTDDKVMKIKSDGSYEYISYSTPYISNASYLIKFVPGISGSIAVNEDIAKAAEAGIEANLKSLNRFLKKNREDPDEEYVDVTYNDLINIYHIHDDDLTHVKDDDFDFTGVPEIYKNSSVIEYVFEIGSSHKKIKEINASQKDLVLQMVSVIQEDKELTDEIISLQTDQAEIEDTFVHAMGSMIRDGYWSDDNYTVGQEESLYRDALDISKKMAFPVVSYSINAQNIWKDFELGQAVRIYDEIARINDYGVITKSSEYVDKPESDSYNVDPDLLDVANKTFASILERATEMAEEVRRNREKYERAASISADGKFRTDMLQGAIDVARTQLLSTASNWKTDANGNIVLESLDGLSAMMLCGSGFMIANSKTELGDWNWRTFGTGNGFTADMITTGFLSADRIEANSIQANKLSSDVGSNLDLSSNNTVRITAGSQITLDAADGIEFSSSARIFQTILGDDELSVSQYLQEAGKMRWILKDSTSQSQMEMTPAAIELMSPQIVLNANQINAVADEIRLETERGAFLQLVDDEIVAGIENDGYVSEINQKADRIDFIVKQDEVSGELSITPEAIALIADKINLTANESVNLLIKSINDHLNTYFDFTSEGLIVRKQSSEPGQPSPVWFTHIDEQGFRVKNTNSVGVDGDGSVFKATQNGVMANGYECGEMRVRKSAHGWIWTDKEV